MSLSDLVWVEKYRPASVQDCIVPKAIARLFSGIVRKGEPLNLLLHGRAGTGKTTIARAMCHDLGCSHILINCSEDSGIDTVRTRVREFASTMSMDGNKKVLILDEFGEASTAFQQALRGSIEEFAGNCRFVLTCNTVSRVLEPIQSRCTPIDFTIPLDERPALAERMFERLKLILDHEGVKYDERVIAALVTRNFPDFRLTLNQVQKAAVGGDIDASILDKDRPTALRELAALMKAKNFSGCRQWAAENVDMLGPEFYGILYRDVLADALKPSCVPAAVRVVGDYMHQAVTSPDRELTAMCLITTIMLEGEFK